MRFPLAVLLLSCLMAGSASGTGIIKKNLGQLAREAEIIAVVRARSSYAAWDTGRKIIWTTTLLEVIEVWKGRPGATVNVREPGGIVPPVGLQVHGMARYRKGETAVVFLKRDVLGQWRTHGAFQGRIPIVRGKDRSWRTTQTGVTARTALSAFKKKVLVLARRKKGR